MSDDGKTGDKTDDRADGAGKRLSDLVAVTVVILTVFMAISKVKDDNINQAMQKAKQESVDAWAEYQAARIKLHLDENGLAQLRLLETGGHLTGQEASGYADDVSRAAEAIGSLLETDDEAVGIPDAGAAVALARDALGWVTQALENADDSSGVISDSAAELLALHLSACQVADPPPDPVELGTYLADLILHDTRGITPALDDYSGLLGRPGVLAIRERIAITRQNLDLSRRLLAISQAKFAAGDSSNLDVMQETATVAGQQAQLPGLIEQEREARNVQRAMPNLESATAHPALDVWSDLQLRALKVQR